MMPVRVVFAVHAHQPSGNPDDIFEQATDAAYLPILETLHRHPNMRINLHMSGPLLEWMEAHRPDVLALADTDQVEWMGGAYHEPILSMIPELDRSAQIRKLADHLEDRFGRRPLGAWLPERVWDPTLAGTLHAAAVDYTLVDEDAFRLAGVHPLRPVVVEHLGLPVTVFPLRSDLRYAIPSEEPELLVARLRTSDESIVVLADDAEKFGFWPDTHERVHGRGRWLDRFFTALDEAPWVEVATFEDLLGGDYDRVHLPAGSYREMWAWAAAPAGDAGWWPMFLDRYPEADVLYRKMLRLSRHAARHHVPDGMYELVLSAQGNDPYWHGAFGGIYYPHLRRDAHRRLIDAQRLLDDSLQRGRAWCYHSVGDWNADRRDEVHAELPDQSWVLAPASGAFLYFDDKPTRWPVTDVVARHEEPGRSSPVDSRPRQMLFDLTGDVDATPVGFASNDCMPASHRYELVDVAADRGSLTVSLAGNETEKSVTAKDRSVSVRYSLSATEGRFGPELPIAAQTLEVRADGGAWLRVDRPLEVSGHRFRLRGGPADVVVASPRPAVMFVFPLVTDFQGPDGPEQITQGFVAWPHWKDPSQGDHLLTIEFG